MLHHILVKWTDEVTDKPALAAEVEQLFQGVLTIEGVHGVTVKPNVINRPNRYDLLICIDMDEQALSAYDGCPTHHHWKDAYSHLVAQKAIFDCD